MDRVFDYVPLTPLANFSGLPAMSVPLGEADGLPISVRFVGRFVDGAAARGEGRIVIVSGGGPPLDGRR